MGDGGWGVGGGGGGVMTFSDYDEALRQEVVD